VRCEGCKLQQAADNVRTVDTSRRKIYISYNQRPEAKPKLWTEAEEEDSKTKMGKCGKAANIRPRL